MQNLNYKIPTPFFEPDDPVFDLFYDQSSFQIKTQSKTPIADIYICCDDYRNTHKYGKHFSKSPKLFHGCKKALNSQRTIIFLLDKLIPNWKNSYTFDRTFKYLKNLIQEFESDAI